MNATLARQLLGELEKRKAPGYVLGAIEKWIKELEAGGMGDQLKARDSVNVNMVSVRR